MIKIIFFQLLIFSVLNAKSRNHDEFFEANIHMQNSKYIDAIKKYESILEKGYQSSNILYNLGNAYYRNDNIGQAVWAYLSSLKLDPRNSDTIYNLNVVRSKIDGVTELPKTIFFIEYYRKVKSKFIMKVIKHFLH